MSNYPDLKELLYSRCAYKEEIEALLDIDKYPELLPTIQEECINALLGSYYGDKKGKITRVQSNTMQFNFVKSSVYKSMQPIEKIGALLLMDYAANTYTKVHEVYEVFAHELLKRLKEKKYSKEQLEELYNNYNAPEINVTLVKDSKSMLEGLITDLGDKASGFFESKHKLINIHSKEDLVMVSNYVCYYETVSKYKDDPNFERALIFLKSYLFHKFTSLRIHEAMSQKIKDDYEFEVSRGRARI